PRRTAARLARALTSRRLAVPRAVSPCSSESGRRDRLLLFVQRRRHLAFLAPLSRGAAPPAPGPRVVCPAVPPPPPPTPLPAPPLAPPRPPCVLSSPRPPCGPPARPRSSPPPRPRAFRHSGNVVLAAKQHEHQQRCDQQRRLARGGVRRQKRLRAAVLSLV